LNAKRDSLVDSSYSENDNSDQKKYISDRYKLAEDDYKTFIVEDSQSNIIEEGAFRDSHHLFDDLASHQRSLIQPTKANFAELNEVSFHNQDLCQVSFVKNSDKNSVSHSRSDSFRMQ